MGARHRLHDPQSPEDVPPARSVRRNRLRHFPLSLSVGTSRLDWKRLLTPTRVRELEGGQPSERVPGESRSEFERDYGRTVYSTPFRRLRDKAQVFPLEPNDSVRTRLLHSLEVSSVAEDIATQAVKEVVKSNSQHLSDTDFRDIPLVAATCGLIHDIGNPPFGHAGELAISTWFENEFGNDTDFFSRLGTKQSASVQDFFNFEGNAQATRILSNVELLVHGDGLNFTAGTMSAGGKYLATSDNVGKNGWHEFSKPGHFISEAHIVDLVRSATGTEGCRHPITYFVEAADDIVYCSVDLEDGIRRGVLSWDDVEAKLLKEADESPLVKRVISAAKKHAEPLKSEGKAYHSALAQTFRIAAISEMAVAARNVFRLRYEDIMNGDYHEELLMDSESEARPLVQASKRILRADLYRHHDILRLEIRGRKVIHDLLSLFWQGVKDYEHAKRDEISPKTYPGKIYLLISDNYRRTFERRMEKMTENPFYCKLQLITDQVVGMTDAHACQIHKLLTNI